MPTISRRAMMTAAAALPVAGRLGAAMPGRGPAPDSRAARPDDEAYWAKIAAQYDVSRDVIQLENGNWGIMAKPVLAAYERAVERVNRENSFYTRRGFAGDYRAIHQRVAAALGVGADEIALTRNATEALQGLIDGYNKLRPGDAVLTADLDYDSMLGCFDGLKARRGVQVVRIALPEPATYQGVIDAYTRAFAANPKIRLVLLTHLSHRTGLVIPVREIVAMARARGIDAIVDAAHSWGQLDFDFADLGVDFAGFNLHKWWGAPLGVGVLYLRKSRVRDIDPDPANGESDPDSVHARVHTGTSDFAAMLTVPDAFDFQQAIGTPARAARLRYLRDRWAEPLRTLDGLQILTPSDPRSHGGITSFRIRGLVTPADNIAVAKMLLDEFGIFTVHRTGVAAGACVRVTPALFTDPAQIDKLAAALPQVVKRLAKG
ncbi:aminotransferase class V-fold PLP-dependent enzyme [Sphingomonas sp. NFR15]|uniref:aminotransferase class V-fold PLP-dependent enzyme n=1 Tax=Sphingomonas sp. NFR15 TaxID=1566282 RepID=UPI000885756F|nr:aminotransferase class V-fold PLP-dependent enzyme [Sphingomonas sp. NFR15]SDA36365.1 Selenocysteine lyase/Cysteine desulfurase [Sphingomonas sp. NFR15]